VGRKGLAVALRCYYCGKKISHYSTEPELGDTYVLILPWRWRSSRNPMTEMPVVMCNEAPLGAKRHTPVPFDEDAARESFHEGLGGLGVTDEHIDAIDSNDDEPAP
jgi:hypothetical protein